MFCEQCGADLPENSSVCQQCGAVARAAAAVGGTAPVTVAPRAAAVDWSASVGLSDWVAAGASLLLFIGLFVPWVSGHDQGITSLSGADYGWLAVISVIAVFTVLALRVFKARLGISSALVYIYFGVFAVIITGITMAIRPFTDSHGYFTGALTRYPFVGAGIALAASLTILVTGIVQRDGVGVPDYDTFSSEFPGPRAADFVAGASALLLFIALFLPWVSSTSSGYAALFGARFGWVAIIGVLLVIVGLVLEFLPFTSPVPTYVIYIVAGGVALLMTALMLAIRPLPVFNDEGGCLRMGLVATLNAATSYTSSGPSIAPYFGAYMGLLASLGILLGGYMKYREE